MTKIKYKDNKLGRHTKGFYKKPAYKGFKARYPGVCISCSGQIQLDDQIGWFEYGKVFHIQCPEAK